MRATSTRPVACKATNSPKMPNTTSTIHQRQSEMSASRAFGSMTSSSNLGLKTILHPPDHGCGPSLIRYCGRPVAEPGFRHNCALLLRSGHEKVKAPKRRRADRGGDGVRCPQKVSFIGGAVLEKN